MPGLAVVTHFESEDCARLEDGRRRQRGNVAPQTAVGRRVSGRQAERFSQHGHGCRSTQAETRTRLRKGLDSHTGTHHTNVGGGNNITHPIVHAIVHADHPGTPHQRCQLMVVDGAGATVLKGGKQGNTHTMRRRTCGTCTQQQSSHTQQQRKRGGSTAAHSWGRMMLAQVWTSSVSQLVSIAASRGRGA